MADSDSSVNSVIPSEVRDLIQEAQKIQGWLERLADHAGGAREAVLEKVRADYESRIDAVSEDLAEHRVQLTEMLDQRLGEVESLRAARDEHAAELEEAKLRHAVGEFSDREWKDRQDKVQESIDDLDELLLGEEATVAELQEITGSLGSGGPRLVPDRQAPASDAAAEDDLAGEDEEDGGAGEAAALPPKASIADVADPEETPAADDPAVSIRAEADDATDSVGAESAGEDETEAGDETGGGEYLDELEFLESLSLADSDRFDAVSAMLDDEEDAKGSD